MTSIHQSEAKGMLIPLPLEKTPSIEAHRLAIPIQRKIEIIQIKEIILLKANGNCMEVHMPNGKSYLANHCLKKFEATLKTRPHNTESIIDSNFQIQEIHHLINS